MPSTTVKHVTNFRPDLFEDFMDNLPFPAYTRRDGVLNGGPFNKPDLGPRLYICWGLAQYDMLASTNLHLDSSDAVNCVVDVTSPPYTSKKYHEGEASYDFSMKTGMRALYFGLFSKRKIMINSNILFRFPKHLLKAGVLSYSYPSKM